MKPERVVYEHPNYIHYATMSEEVRHRQHCSVSGRGGVFRVETERILLKTARKRLEAIVAINQTLHAERK